MGLDIRSWTRATLAPEHLGEDEWCEVEDHVTAFVYQGFEQSLDGLVADRCYEVSGDSVHFHAGSYGGYGQWRSDLAATALGTPIEAIWNAPDPHRERPFFELLNFADNEGTIGPLAAARLAVDFAEHRTAYMDGHEDEYARSKFDAWQTAFELAAQGGLVRFA